MRTFVLIVAVAFGGCVFDESGFEIPPQTDGEDTPALEVASPDDSFYAEPDPAEPVPTCLIISEYIEGSGYYNKALELFNCGGESLDPSGFGICLVRNDETDCTITATLAGAGSLDAGAVLTLCRSTEGHAGDPVDTIRTNCDLPLGQVMSFNGDDRLIVFRDVDASGDFDSEVDETMDLLGQPSERPTDAPWQDKALRRCDFTPALGPDYDYTELFTEYSRDDVSDYGVAPTEGC